MELLVAGGKLKVNQMHMNINELNLRIMLSLFYNFFF